MEKGNGENEKNEALPISLFPPPSFCHAIPNNNPSAAYYRLYRSTSEQSSSGSVDCSKGDPEDQVSAMFAGIVGVMMSKRRKKENMPTVGVWP